MKLKLTVSIACLFMLSPQLIAQRTVTNKGYGGKVIEQYNVNANGDMHGAYKTWNRQGRLIKNYSYQNGELHGNCLLYFDNGTVQEESTYYKGTMTSLKVYQYNENGTKRKLIRNATWDRSGNVLTDGDNAGTLPNGRWRFNYPRYGDYSETYNGNDTLYVWDDRAKQRFLGKQIDEIFIESEKSIYDVIKEIEEINTKYSNCIANTLERSEYNLYSFMCKYFEIGDNYELKDMIMDAIGIPLDVTELNFTVERINDNEQFAAIVVTNKITNEIIAALPSCNKANDLYLTHANNKDANSKQALNDAKLKQRQQSKLLGIVAYCNDNNLP